MNQVVVDCSVTMCWGLPDEASDYAEAALKAVHEFGGVVPQLWLWEVANTIPVCERRGRMTLPESERFVNALKRVPLEIDSEDSQDRLADLLTLSRRFQLTAYDAAYLELARRKSLRLCTLDRELIRAAPTAGVAIFELPASLS